MTNHMASDPPATSAARRGVLSEAKPSRKVCARRRAAGRKRSGRPRKRSSKSRSVAPRQTTAKRATRIAVPATAAATTRTRPDEKEPIAEDPARPARGRGRRAGPARRGPARRRSRRAGPRRGGPRSRASRAGRSTSPARAGSTVLAAKPTAVARNAGKNGTRPRGRRIQTQRRARRTKVASEMPMLAASQPGEIDGDLPADVRERDAREEERQAARPRARSKLPPGTGATGEFPS